MKKHLKDYFIPHEGNNYAPNSLQKFSVIVMVLLIVASFAAANIQALFWVSSEWLVSTILPAVIVDITNEERENETLVKLRRNPVLDEAARRKAAHMAQNEYFAHYSPDGLSPWYWFDGVGYTFVHAGENLAVHFTDSSDVVKGWMDSPGHRANILSGNYTEIGVGTAQGTYKGTPTVFVVQLFGTPAVPPQPVELAAADPDVAQATANTSGEAVTVETVTESDTQDETSVAPADFETVPASGSSELQEPGETPGATEETESPSDPEAAPQEPPLAFIEISTTTGAVPLTADSTPNELTGEAPTIARTATQPHLSLQLIYSLLSLVVVIALLLSIAIEWRRQHPVQIAYGTGLLATMVLLFFIHSTVSGGALIL